MHRTKGCVAVMRLDLHKRECEPDELKSEKLYYYLYRDHVSKGLQYKLLFSNSLLFNNAPKTEHKLVVRV